MVFPVEGRPLGVETHRRAHAAPARWPGDAALAQLTWMPSLQLFPGTASGVPNFRGRVPVKAPGLKTRAIVAFRFGFAVALPAATQTRNGCGRAQTRLNSTRAG